MRVPKNPQIPIVAKQMKSEERIEQKYKKVSCPFCSSNNVIKRGIRETENRGKVQRYGCKDCSKRFSIDDGFWKMKNHEKKITLCMDLYYCLLYTSPSPRD